MSVYKFRVWFDDHEDIYREIEIKATQTFYDLHNAIQEAVGFDNKHAASFFLSDDLWRKGEEIVLKSEDANKNKDKPKRLMNKSKLAAFIDDPHQKFIYLFDYAASWLFCVELSKILSEDTLIAYPRVVKSNGVAKKQYKTLSTPPPVVEDDDESFSVKKKGRNEEDPTGDEEAYAVADEEDIDKLEQEDEPIVVSPEESEELGEGFSTEEGDEESEGHDYEDEEKQEDQ